MDARRLALIIANEEYQDPGLSRLRSAPQDAAALSRVLGDPDVGDFDVVVVRNESSHEIQVQIEDFFVEARAADLLLLHFACHGLKSDSGELFFAATNTRPTRLGSTAVPAEFVQRCMRGSRSRSVVLLLDCCYGGAFSQGATVRAAGNVAPLDSFPAQRLGRGRAVITASSAMEYAFEGDRLADALDSQPSVFTGALVEGLTTGDADRDEDGLISLDDLYDYLFQRVTELNPAQTPQRNFELEGEVYLAKSHRRRITPIPLPGDLKEALSHTSAWARVGAVTELRTRLTSDNLGVAKAAYEALQQIAAHDIQQVAGVAQSALAEAALQPTPARLSFGELAQGSASAEQLIRLVGIPICRVATARSVDERLKVRQTADTFHLTVDTSAPGSLSTELIIEGSVGTVSVQVEAQIVAKPERHNRSLRIKAISGKTVDSPEQPVQTPLRRPIPAPLFTATPSSGRPAATSEADRTGNDSPLPAPTSAPNSSSPPEPDRRIQPKPERTLAGDIELAGPYPGMGRRFLAWLLDFALWLAPTCVGGALHIWVLYGLALCGVPAGNFITLVYRGQTFGMRPTNIRLVNAQTGATPSWRSVLVRSGIIFAGWFPGLVVGRILLARSALSDPGGRLQGRADRIAGTLLLFRTARATPDTTPSPPNPDSTWGMR